MSERPPGISFSSLSAKIFATIILGALLAVAAAGYSAFTFTKSVLQQAIMNNQLEIARQSMNRIDRMLYERFNNIHVIAGEYSLENFLVEAQKNADHPKILKKNLQKKLKALTIVTGPWDILFVADKDGKIVLSTKENEIGKEIKEEANSRVAYESAMKGKVYYSDIIISDDTGKPTVIFAAPVRDSQDPTKPVTGVVIGNFSWPAILEILNEMPTFAVLLDREGEVIGDNSSAIHLAPFDPSERRIIVRRVNQGRSIIVPRDTGILPEETLTSVATQAGHLSFQGHEWLLLLNNPTRVAFAPANKAAGQIILILLPIIILMSGGILLMIHRSIIRPIGVLMETIHGISEGDLTRQAPAVSNDEIGRLGRSFNNMTARLREFQEKLEEKIKERTGELESSQEALRTEKERLAVTLKSIGDAVITTDVEGRVILINSVAEQLTGWSQEEALGRPLGDIFNIIHEETRQPCENPVEKVLKTKGVITLANHTALVSRDGRERIIEDSGAPIRLSKDGEIIGVVLVFRDVTENKKLQGMVLQADKMAAMGQLAGGIAHDLNNGLTPVMGYLDFLLSETKEGTSTHDLLSEAKQSAKRCADVVEKLLSYSRPSTQVKGRMQLQKMLVEYKSILRTVLPATIDVQMRCPEDIGAVYGNETEIMAVLVNLAINSRDAMAAKGGAFTVEAKNFYLEKQAAKQSFTPGNYVVISATDTGTGMSPKVMQKIFEPFFTTKAKGKGTGLGLSMVFNTVKDHGGWMDVSSQEGVGTTFQIYLPAASEDTVQKDLPSENLSSLPKGDETVLFVDDEETMRNMGKVFLGRLGYKLIFASDGEEALEIYRQRQSEISAIILDMTMPKLTGREAIRRLRQINSEVKIIVSSGYTSEGNAKDLIEDGARAFLPKPYLIGTVAGLLRKVLDT